MKTSIRMLVLALTGLTATAVFAEDEREAGRRASEVQAPAQVALEAPESDFTELLKLEREKQKAELERLKAEYGRAASPLLVSTF